MTAEFAELTMNRAVPLFLRKRIKVDREKKCWFISEDWSIYTQITVDGKPVKAHRYIFKLFNPTIPIEGFMVCHTCDRPGCINPKHLFRGTARDNFEDARRKGRVKQFNFPNKEKAKEMKRLRELDNWKQLRRFAGE